MDYYRIFVLSHREPVITDDQNRVVDVRTGERTRGESLARYIAYKRKVVPSPALFPKGKCVVILPHFPGSNGEIYRVKHSQGITTSEFRLIRISYLKHTSEKQPYERELEQAYERLENTVRRIRQLVCAKGELADVTRRIRRLECLRTLQHLNGLERAILKILSH